MDRKIIRLSDELINQIAAGEVVENPASVVKELIENSLDATPRKIEIRCERGGFSLIQVDDDGCGMSREDALLSLERHATSKIRTSDDLLTLMTMGFRGEALAAIAAISQLEIQTSLGFEATHLRACFGKIADIQPMARNRGTTVQIKSLFENVPARRKFQKSIPSCTAQIHKTVEMIALAHPNIAFSLQLDGKLILDVRAQGKKERIEALLQSFPHEGSHPMMWGLFGSPQDVKSHRRNQFLYVNGRPIFSPLISRAVKEGYGTRIQEHDHPCFILFLELPPDQVDFNVHPQKKEVRFKEERELFLQVRKFLVSVFEKEVKAHFPEPISFEPRAHWTMAEEPALPKFSKTSTPLFLSIAFEEKALTVFDGYLLLEKEELILLDLDAATRRIAFERGSDPPFSKQYSLEEAVQIWKELQKCRDSLYDPLGRLIWKTLQSSDLEKILI